MFGKSPSQTHVCLRNFVVACCRSQKAQRCMKLQFKVQQHQTDAVDAVVESFVDHPRQAVREGRPLVKTTGPHTPFFERTRTSSQGL